MIADHAAVLEFRKRVLAAKTEAETEKPKLLQAITQLRQPVPKPPARLPTDLVPLQPGDREYAEFTKQWASIPAVKIRQVKRVNNPEQAQRFDRYAASLGQGDPSQQLKLLHGTHPVANANSIARKGPDINRAGSANGTRFGQGFYTAETPDEVVKYATDQGAVCVCTAAPGVMKYNGDTSVTAGTLAAEGFHSVVRGDWHVLFHPDSLRVDYVVDFGPDDTIDARKAKAEQDAREQHALAVEVRAQEVRAKENRVAMGAYFVERCDAAAAGVEGLSGEKFGMRRKVFQLEAQQYGQGLPIYAFKKQFLESLQRANGLVLEGGTGVGKRKPGTFTQVRTTLKTTIVAVKYLAWTRSETVLNGKDLPKPGLDAHICPRLLRTGSGILRTVVDIAN